MPRAIVSITDIDEENNKIMGIVPQNRYTDELYPGMMVGDYFIEDIKPWDDVYYMIIISGDRVAGDIRCGQPMITIIY